jgi:membrane peptidoglycan carboxypeptidase
MKRKPSARRKALKIYSNLTTRHRNKTDARARRKAEYLATLPKQPLKRLFYRLHPKRVFKFWFSRRGIMMTLKLIGVAFIILAIFVAALFAYYRRELDTLSPGELAKRVQTTITKYTDRNGVLLWEDKGNGDYKMVIDSKEIPKVMKDATIAIEDKDFYKHGGISITGIMRAGISNASGGEVQGASTLTQQLIKLVFFAKDAEQNRINVSRKIKEMILAIEVERMYNKDQILTLYLNEAPYGGRRGGVESASLTYFGKHAKDLTLAEAALLASIPQNPSKYNPDPTYITPDSAKALINRQHQVLSNMAEQGYITKKQAEEAKKLAILDTVKPEISNEEDIKAPHFVLTVQKQLESEFGSKVAREGGLTIKTTLDYRIQQRAEEAITKNFKYAQAIGANNMATTAVDVPTGQILTMVGSYDFRDKTIGAYNSATAQLNPGSSIKPFMYANLFKPQSGQNYGAGSILADENIDKLYGGQLRNYDNGFFGAITIRQALGNSRNPPAVKAAYIGGLDKAIKTAQDAGDTIYCKGFDYGLSAAIGSCAVTEVQHTNAYATLGRQGVYKPESYVLEVKNSQGQTLKQWKDESKRVLDSQITYILSDILSDNNARSRVFGSHPPGFNVPGVKTATKTGTTDDGHGHAKDSWMMSYSPRMAVGIWTGRNDTKPLTSLSSTGNANVIMDIQNFAHTELFAKDGSWKANDWFERPAGIQTLTVSGKTDIFPSWYSKANSNKTEKMTFDQVSRKKATNCTPDSAKIELDVQSYEDAATKQKSYTAPEGYDPKADDDVHKCEDSPPSASITTQNTSGKNYAIVVTISQGTFPLSSVSVKVDDQEISNQPVGGSGSLAPINYSFSNSGSHNISVTVTDQGMYQGSASIAQVVASNPPPAVSVNTNHKSKRKT